MARPTNKVMLLELAASNYSKLIHFIDELPEGMKNEEFPQGTMNRRISDVLFHLVEWHQLLQDWYRIGRTGAKPPMPEEGYTWKTTSALNKMLWERNKNRSLDEARQALSSSRDECMQLIEGHSNEELFEKKRYKWTGSTSLAAYLISASSSHYDWAFKLIRKSMKPILQKSTL